MTYSNDQIDKLITQALDEEDKKYYQELEQPNILELHLHTYKGERKWLSIWVTFMMFIIIALTWYAAIMFFKVEEIRTMLIWGFSFITGIITITALKIWFWMQMNSIATLREIKRLELQIAMKKNK